MAVLHGIVKSEISKVVKNENIPNTTKGNAMTRGYRAPNKWVNNNPL